VTGDSTRANQVAKDFAGGSPLVGSGAGATRVAIGSGELVPLRHLSAGTRLRLILLGLPIYSLIQVKHL
jgi:hypothetical protein